MSNFEPALPADLFEQVYDQLRRVAQERLRGERAGHTLQATALVHEVWMRFAGDQSRVFNGQAQFFAAAGEAMRRILIDHARARRRLKRGGGRRALADVPLDAIGSVADLARLDAAEEILAFDQAFRRLEEQNARFAAVVRLRFFAGLSVDETA